MLRSIKSQCLNLQEASSHPSHNDPTRSTLWSENKPWSFPRPWACSESPKIIEWHQSTEINERRNERQMLCKKLKTWRSPGMRSFFSTRWMRVSPTVPTSLWLPRSVSSTCLIIDSVTTKWSKQSLWTRGLAFRRRRRRLWGHQQVGDF